MTIRGLWTIVKDKSKRSSKVAPRNSFKGRRIAIDANGLFYNSRAVAHKRVTMKTDVMTRDPDQAEIDRIWLNSCFDEISDMILDGITPILVYDGKALPEKLEEHKARSKTKDGYKEKLAAIRAKKSSNEFKEDAKLQKEARYMMTKLTSIPEESMLMIRSFFESIGVPTIVGTGDGERLCSALCAVGKAAAVYSSDGDCLAHLAPYVIRKPGPKIISGDGKRIVKSYLIASLDDILSDLNLTKPKFRELCIMLGTDYNSNVKGMGPVNCLRLIKAYGNIDDIEWPERAGDPATLKLEATRRLFETKDLEDITEVPGDIDLAKWDISMDDTLRMYGMEKQSKKWKCVLENAVEAKDFIHANPKRRGRMITKTKDYDEIPELVREDMAPLAPSDYKKWELVNGVSDDESVVSKSFSEKLKSLKKGKHEVEDL